MPARPPPGAPDTAVHAGAATRIATRVEIQPPAAPHIIVGAALPSTPTRSDNPAGDQRPDAHAGPHGGCGTTMEIQPPDAPPNLRTADAA